MDLTALLVDLVASPWMPLVVLAVCLIDGFFPPVPSETTVVAALAVALAAGEVPQAVVIVLAAASGAIAGDSIAYAVGRKVGLERFGWMRRERVRKVSALLRERVQRSPAMLLLVARYIPVGRVAVNATAGATRLPYGRFLPLSAVAGTAWAAMCLVVAGASAAWLGDPLWASLAAIAIMLLFGVIVDAIARRRSTRRERTGDLALRPGA
jgi:membrane protein DedA with SNARE-associated domain